METELKWFDSDAVLPHYVQFLAEVSGCWPWWLCSEEIDPDPGLWAVFVYIVAGREIGCGVCGLVSGGREAQAGPAYQPSQAWCVEYWVWQAQRPASHHHRKPGRLLLGTGWFFGSYHHHVPPVEGMEGLYHYH